jgi:hypothetical protein
MSSASPPMARVPHGRPSARRLVAWLSAFLSFVLGSAVFLGFPGFARADDLRAMVDANVVEVGQTVALRLEGSSSRGEVTNVESGPTPGFRVVGRSVMPSRMVSITNGVRTDRVGVSATFTLVAERVGTFTLGPCSATFDGRVRKSDRMEVRVVPKGQGPRRQDPLDPFGQLFAPHGSPRFDSLLEPDPPEPTLDPKLALPKARGAVGFLHATVDKTRAVVGEQVTFAVYLYVEADGREPQIGDVHEAPASDYLKKTLLENESEAKHVGLAKVGDRIYEVKLVRRAALFPLKAGILPVGSMSMRIFRSVNQRTSPLSVRESEPLDVTVVEPPAIGRPPGTNPGDVGDFALRAEVTPRDVDRGDAVSVTLTVEGRGNFPNRLVLPTANGAEWLDPEIREKLGADTEERYGGTRTFKYVVRMREPGSVSLGTVQFPHYSPFTKKYQMARAELGFVTVKDDGKGKGSGAGSTEVVMLPNLPAPRGRLEGGPRAAVTPFSDRREAWLLVFVSPLALVSFVSLGRLRERLAIAKASRRESPEAELTRRLGAADDALSKGDFPGAVRAALTVLEQGAEVSLGVIVKGASAARRRELFSDAGLDERTIDAWLDAFTSGEARRYAPAPPTEAEAREEISRAKALVRAGKKGPGK